MADLDRVWGSAFKVWGLGLGSGSRVQGLGFGASCFGADLWQSWRSRSTGEEDRAKTCPCRVGGWGAAAAAVCDEDGRKLLELSRNFSQDPDLLWPAAAASPARCCGGAGGGGGGAGWEFWVYGGGGGGGCCSCFCCCSAACSIAAQRRVNARRRQHLTRLAF